MKWNKTLLADLVEPPISGEWGSGEGTTKVIRTTNFTNRGRLDLSNVVERDIDTKKVQQKRLLYGDIIIEKSGGSPSQPVGRVVFFDAADDTYLCNNFTSVLRANPAMNPRYLFWHLFYLHQSGHTLRFQNKTTGIINLQLKRYLKETNIFTPPLDVQTHIANTLDKADALRRKDQELLHKYHELAQSIFYDIFGDPVQNDKGWNIRGVDALLSTVKDGTKCGPFGSALKKEEYLNAGVPVWVMDNIKNGLFDETGCLYISESKFAELKNYAVESGDIIISRAGTVGKMCVVRTQHPHSIISTNLIRLSLDQSLIDPEYFVSLFKFFGTRIGRLRTGADGAFTHMNTSILCSLSIPVPPIEVQAQYVRALANLRASQDLIMNGRTDSLFSSLLQQYFS